MAHFPGQNGNDVSGPIPDRVRDAMGMAGADAARRVAGENTGLPLTPGGQPDPNQSLEALFQHWLKNKIPQLMQMFVQELQSRGGQQGMGQQGMGPQVPPASAGGGPTQPGLLGRPY